MGLTANMPITDIKVDHVFIGSCTNGRIEDLRAAAAIAKGRKVAAGVNAIVVPGSGLVKEQAEEEGLDKVFVEAGFEWRDPGCSMCLAMNADKLKEGERCASTSNRNFEGRQGRGGRTHLVSPAMAAAAAVTGHLTDVRTLKRRASFASRELTSRHRLDVRLLARRSALPAHATKSIAPEAVCGARARRGISAAHAFFIKPLFPTSRRPSSGPRH